MGKMFLLDNVVNKQCNQVEGFCIIKSVAEKTNVKGSLYLDLVFSDAGGEINAKLWDYDKNAHAGLTAGSIVMVRGTVTQWRDTDQLKVERIRLYVPETDYIEMGQLVPCAPYDVDWMYGELVKCAESFSDADLKKLILYMLEDKKENFLHWPAALKLHHAHRGGLIYHTFSMLKLARGICECYPALNSDIVYAGIIVHDLAKMEELSVGELGISTGYSVRGQLIGHIAMGVANIELAAKETGVSDELKTLMQHIVLAHHSNPEFGSPKPPMFPEAEVVATVDMLDARMYEMYDALETVENGGFSERQWAMDNRMLYKLKP